MSTKHLHQHQYLFDFIRSVTLLPAQKYALPIKNITESTVLKEITGGRDINLILKPWMIHDMSDHSRCGPVEYLEMVSLLNGKPKHNAGPHTHYKSSIEENPHSSQPVIADVLLDPAVGAEDKGG